ncbi:MAG: KamA family radical SAM protein, partial [Elusimicrobia bacterium]|nr:KamA family radical SAM protein [Elusimicrobiota bacterium]MBD3412052.1 KamA family radical SAM protein [Elusimicrobiota bacterium]
MIDRKKLNRKIKQLWAANKQIHRILHKSTSMEKARSGLYEYLWSKEQELFQARFTIHPLQKVNIRECIRVFKNILAPRNEVLTGYSVLLHLWRMAKMPRHKDILAVSPGFIEEMRHLFGAVSGISHMHSLKKIPRFLKYSGRKAARLRSNDLDRIYRHCERFMKRYHSGLEPDIIEKRINNKKRIMGVMRASETQWADWSWQLKHIIRDEVTLGKLIELTRDEKSAIRTAKVGRLPFGITPHYVSLMDQSGMSRTDHAIRAQVIPPLSYVEQMMEYQGDQIKQADFMLEADTSPVDLITRRYPMVTIIKPYNTCPQICQYCQRNWEIDDVMAEHALAPSYRIGYAVGWIRKHPAIKEVLLTGGDPLTLNTEDFEKILSDLSSIPHLERIRICTRTLVTLPQRFTSQLLRVLHTYHKP